MAKTTRLDRAIDNAGEKAADDVQNSIREVMEQFDVDTPELADRLCMSKENLERMLKKDSRNLSIKAVGRIFSALGTEMYVYVCLPTDKPN